MNNRNYSPDKIRYPSRNSARIRQDDRADIFVARFLAFQHRYYSIVAAPRRAVIPLDSGPLLGGSHKSAMTCRSGGESNAITSQPEASASSIQTARKAS